MTTVALRQFFACYAKGSPPFMGATLEAWQGGKRVLAVSGEDGWATVSVAPNVFTIVRVSVPVGCAFQSGGTQRTLTPIADRVLTRLNVVGTPAVPVTPPAPVPPVPVPPAPAPVADLLFEEAFGPTLART